MKKVYDWNIEVTIQVENNNKHISIICSVHTTIHALKIEICKKLGMLVFDTEVDLYGGTENWRPMKPTSTLQQNGINKSQAQIRAVIKRVKKNLPLDVTIDTGLREKKSKHEDAVENSAFGLNL